MRTAYDAATVRAAEEPLLATQPEGTLMALAASGLARVCAGLLDGVYGARVLLLVGAGNNGGDALYAGALLARRGARVEALLLSDRVHEAGLAALRRAGGRAVDDVGAPDLVVDGILGIGGRGSLRDRAAEVVGRLPDDALVVAVDVPSGIDASTGEVDGVAVRADVTVTFGALKVGLLVDPGADHAGVVELIEIGLDLPPATVEVLQADDVAALLPRPERESDKYRRGVVGVAAGSAEYTGAAVLCTGGALQGLCGDGALRRRRRAGGAGPGSLARGRRRRGAGAGLDGRLRRRRRRGTAAGAGGR